jgi:multidrug efflux pump subunit AcrA (membrane-fusion protein)
MPLDTLKVAKRLREAGFDEAQAEAVVAAVQEGAERSDVATKADLAEIRNELAATKIELNARIAALAVRLDARIAGLESSIDARIAGLEASIDARIAGLASSIDARSAEAKTEIIYRMLQMIRGAVLVNFIGMAGLMFALVKLLGHRRSAKQFA